MTILAEPSPPPVQAPEAVMAAGSPEEATAVRSNTLP